MQGYTCQWFYIVTRKVCIRIKFLYVVFNTICEEGKKLKRLEIYDKIVI